MRKLIFAALAAAFLVLSCDNGSVENGDDYDITSGVYPYEVADITHSWANFPNASISWKNPANKNFHNVRITMFSPNDPDYVATINGYVDINILDFSHGVTGDLKPNRTSVDLINQIGTVDYSLVIIRCVDKYGNVSEGVRHDWTPGKHWPGLGP